MEARGPIGRRTLAATIALALTAGCAQRPAQPGPVPDVEAATPASDGLLDAGPDAARVIADFDAAVGAPRFLTILSPT